MVSTFHLAKLPSIPFYVFVSNIRLTGCAPTWANETWSLKLPPRLKSLVLTRTNASNVQARHLHDPHSLV